MPQQGSIFERARQLADDIDGSVGKNPNQAAFGASLWVAAHQKSPEKKKADLDLLVKLIADPNVSYNELTREGRINPFKFFVVDRLIESSVTLALVNRKDFVQAYEESATDDDIAILLITVISSLDEVGANSVIEAMIQNFNRLPSLNSAGFAGSPRVNGKNSFSEFARDQGISDATAQKLQTKIDEASQAVNNFSFRR